MELFFATNNPHKLEEIRAVLGGRFNLKSFRDLDVPLEVEETEPTLRGNALLKAKALHAHTGLPCFGDDTGLEVDALGGRPGVRSARYAGENATYDQNVEKLLGELAGKSARSARFRTVIAYYDGAEPHFFEGIIEGKIIGERRGNNGFGYDPVFLPDGYERTFAELPPETKHRISHRGLAVKQFATWIRSRS